MTRIEFFAAYDKLPRNGWTAKIDEAGRVKLRGAKDREFTYVPLTAVCKVAKGVGFPAEAFEGAAAQLRIDQADIEIIHTASGRREMGESWTPEVDEARGRIFQPYKLR